MRGTTIFLVSVLLGVALSQSRQHYCGPGLENALRNFCNASYNKRSNPDSGKISESVDAEDPDMLPDYEAETGSMFTDRRHATALMGKRSRRIRIWGVASECCSKACTVQELMSYCAEAP